MSEVIYPPCKKCGATHRMGIKNRLTEEITPLDICRNCMFVATINNLHIEDAIKEWDEKFKNNG